MPLREPQTTSLTSLAASLRGPLWLTAVPPLFFGSWISLRITVPDPLAFGLALFAIFLATRHRYRWAVLVAIAAVLIAPVLLFA